MSDGTGRSRRPLLIGGGVLLVVVVLGALVWYFVLRDDAPPPVTLEDAVEEVRGADAEDPDGEDPDREDPDAGDAGDAGGPTGVEGTWVLVPEAGGTFVGYRVREELAGIGAATAVGRTSAVTGDLVIEGTTVLEVRVVADLTRLESDDNRRDGQMRTQGLETDRFPEATFELTEPIDLGSVPAEEEAIQTEAVGELTLHGVTREVILPLEAELVEGRIVVVGSLEILFADYDIETPSSLLVLSIEDRGEMEVQLIFERT